METNLNFGTGRQEEVSLLGTRAPRLALSTLVIAIDLWAVVSALWVSRLAFDRLSNFQLGFAILVHAAVALPLAEPRLTSSVLEDIGPIFKRVTICFAVCAAASVSLGRGEVRLLLWSGLLTFSALLVGRSGAYLLAHSSDVVELPKAVLLGAGKVARQIISVADRCPDYAFELLGALDDEPRFGREELGRPVLGQLDDLSAVVRVHRVEVVIVAFTTADPERLIGLVRIAQTQGASVWAVPRFFELGLPGGAHEHLWGLPLVKIVAPARTRPTWIIKRALDFPLSALALLLAAPIMGIIALATLIESGRPVLFKQRRISTNGREFDIYKFRTMAGAAEAVASTEWAPDPRRVTRVGRILRRTCLDELPQLFNVLRGEMSIVGPRPERPFFAEDFKSRYRGYDGRHRVPAGITGWAQVSGLRGSETPIEDRIAFDNYYIENWSLSEDLKILARTARALGLPEEKGMKSL